ncbi:MAG: hypothetical protein E7355_02105 [Clostridiales bacterium]|nr:hypothetical protein [Clostridiales bacterium]
MKKQWLVLGMAAMMSLGCLFACGDGDDKGGDSGVIKGEKVTEQQWAAAPNSVDYKYVVVDYWEKLEGDGWSEEYEEKCIWNGDMFYEYEKDNEDVYISKSWDWEIVRNGKVYWYSKCEEGEEAEAGPWKEFDWTNHYETLDEYLSKHFYFDKEDVIEEEWAEFDMADFTFDEEKGVYYQTTTDEEETEKIEILFLDGKLYSVKWSCSWSDEEGKGEEYEIYTFKKEEIPALPDEEGLNALIAQNQ